jgi:hypothetical protein
LLKQCSRYFWRVGGYIAFGAFIIVTASAMSIAAIIRNAFFANVPPPSGEQTAPYGKRLTIPGIPLAGVHTIMF